MCIAGLQSINIGWKPRYSKDPVTGSICVLQGFTINEHMGENLEYCRFMKNLLHRVKR